MKKKEKIKLCYVPAIATKDVCALLRWSYSSAYECGMYCMDWFADIGKSLYPWDKSLLIMGHGLSNAR